VKPAAYKIIMPRYNHRLCRVALSAFEAPRCYRVLAAVFGRLADKESAPL